MGKRQVAKGKTEKFLLADMSELKLAENAPAVKRQKLEDRNWSLNRALTTWLNLESSRIQQLP